MGSMEYISGARTRKYPKWRFLVLLLVVSIVIGIVFYVSKQKKSNITKVDNVSRENSITETKQVVENVELMPETLKGYTIVGKLEIEKIDVDKYILGKTNDESLDISITKLWGGKINTPGNFSIIGHNREDQFIKLKKLEVGDEFSLTGRDGKKVIYQIYQIETVNPDNVDCIESKEDSTRQVTLITCTTSGLKRLVLKGKEI